MAQNLYSWEFDDSKNRDSMWYILALSLVLGISIWGFFTKQYGLSFIVLLISGLYYFVQNNSEDQIKVAISKLGVKIDSTFYDFESINSFGIVYKGSVPILLRFYLNKKGIRSIDVQITEENVIEIKNILNNYIKETPKIELTFSEKMTKLLKL